MLIRLTILCIMAVTVQLAAASHLCILSGQ